MRKTLLTAVLLAAAGIAAFARNTPLKAGDAYDYKLTYHVIGLSYRVAEVQFFVEEGQFDGKPVLVIENKNRIISMFEHFFGYSDIIHSMVDPVSGKPLYYFRGISTKDDPLMEEYHYDWQGGKASGTYVNRSGEIFNVPCLPLHEYSADFVSAIVSSVSRLDIDGMKKGSITTLYMLLRGKSSAIQLKYNGKEKDIHLFTAFHSDSGFFNEDEGKPISVRVSAGPSQHVISVEYPVRIGKLRFQLVQ